MKINKNKYVWVSKVTHEPCNKIKYYLYVNAIVGSVENAFT